MEHSERAKPTRCLVNTIYKTSCKMWIVLPYFIGSRTLTAALNRNRIPSFRFGVELKWTRRFPAASFGLARALGQMRAKLKWTFWCKCSAPNRRLFAHYERPLIRAKRKKCQCFGARNRIEYGFSLILEWNIPQSTFRTAKLANVGIFEAIWKDWSVSIWNVATICRCLFRSQVSIGVRFQDLFPLHIHQLAVQTINKIWCL